MNFARVASTVLIVAGVALLLAQLVPVQDFDPPSEGDISAPPAIEATLRRACYDCHSNETRWPWYRRIAPVSWLVARDVERGRRQINFSEWGAYYPATRKRKLQWSERAVREHAMAPSSYLLIHPGARLSDADRSALENWIESSTSASSPETSSPGQ
ncbi:MAG TPA: heme-binding domain-containing protein [Candidatus Binataceae bacterium]